MWKAVIDSWSLNVFYSFYSIKITRKNKQSYLCQTYSWNGDGLYLVRIREYGPQCLLWAFPFPSIWISCVSFFDLLPYCYQYRIDHWGDHSIISIFIAHCLDSDQHATTDSITKYCKNNDLKVLDTALHLKGIVGYSKGIYLENIQVLFVFTWSQTLYIGFLYCVYMHLTDTIIAKKNVNLQKAKILF